MARQAETVALILNITLLQIIFLKNTKQWTLNIYQGQIPKTSKHNLNLQSEISTVNNLQVKRSTEQVYSGHRAYSTNQ